LISPITELSNRPHPLPLSPRERGGERGATSGEGPGVREDKGEGLARQMLGGRPPFIMIHQIIKSTQYQILNI